MKPIKQRYLEFRAIQPGGVVGECAKTCLAYARAEYLGERFQIDVRWECDTDAPGPEDWTDDTKYLEQWYKSDHYCEYAYIENDGDHLAGLGGIWDADTDYRRIVEAELLLEVIPFNTLGYRFFTKAA